MSETCEKCDNCVKACPIMEIDKTFKINDIFFEENPEIWKCCSCFLCEAVCPNKLSVREELFKKRRKEGKEALPKRIQKYHDNIMKQGFALPIEELQQHVMKKLGLSEINLEKIKRSLEKILSENER